MPIARGAVYRPSSVMRPPSGSWIDHLIAAFLSAPTLAVKVRLSPTYNVASGGSIFTGSVACLAVWAVTVPKNKTASTVETTNRRIRAFGERGIMADIPPDEMPNSEVYRRRLLQVQARFTPCSGCREPGFCWEGPLQSGRAVLRLLWATVAGSAAGRATGDSFL